MKIPTLISVHVLLKNCSIVRNPRIKMTDSEETQKETQQQLENVREFQGASLLKQIAVITKIRFFHRFRNPRIIIEIVMPLTFLIFICLFNTKQDKYADDLPTTEGDQILPFFVIPGVSPKFAIIPNNTLTQSFMATLGLVSGIGSEEFLQSSTFFDSFEDYETYIDNEREINESFYVVELIENESEALFRISSSGMTIGTLPNYIENLCFSRLLMQDQTSSIQFSYQEMPHGETLVPDWYSGLAISLFGFFFIINGITNVGTTFADEAETGLRDYLTFYGLTNLANNISWLIISLVPIWIPTIPFAIAISAQLDINFGVVFLLYIDGFFALTTFIMFMMAFSPSMSTGTYIGLITSLLYLVLQLVGYYLFLTEVGSDIAKNILSIIPLAAFGYSLVMMASGRVRSFSDINTVKEYSVKYAFVYLVVEGVVFYILFYLIDYLKHRKWYKAPYTWKYSKPELKPNPIQVNHLVKEYDDYKAVNDMTFSINIGEIVAIVGPNGAGKTTLLGLLSGATPTTSGSVKFNNVDLTENIITAHNIVGFCPQENIFYPTLTPTEWMDAICILRGMPNFDYMPIIQALGLETQLKKRLGEMSGGNKRKVCLSIALLCDPSILLLDEATSGVDFTSRTRIWSLISSMKGKTIIMATHTLEECEKIADKIMVLSHGRVAEYDIPTKLRQSYKCGYVIEVDKKYQEDAETVIKEFLQDYDLSFDESDEVLKYYIPQNENIHFSELLKSLTFPYLLGVQSLEERIFEQVKKIEDQYAAEHETKKEDDEENIEP